MTHVFVIFGGTGDLAKKKLYPALFKMHKRGLKFSRVMACARSPLSHQEFVETATVFMQKERQHPKMQSFMEKLQYLQMDFSDRASFRLLKEKLPDDLEVAVCHLAVPEDAFAPIIRGIAHALPERVRRGKIRLLVEKPFGHDLKSARRLNRLMQKAVGEQGIYRIDHFLAKEVVENLLILRFANELFRAVWNYRHIESVQISFSEQGGMGSRSLFYEKTGALRDFVQSHIMQVIGLLAMEDPGRLDDDNSVKNRKAAVLRKLKPLSRGDVVFGQYTKGKIGGIEVPGYAGEEGVAAGSKVETYVALRAFVNTPRWKGVPFYIRTGKRLGHKSGVISIVFKGCEKCDFGRFANAPKNNVLQLVVQPQELFMLHFNLKTPYVRPSIKDFSMEYCYSCEHINYRRLPYEKIFENALRGEKTRFSRSDEVEYAWKWLETLRGRPKVHHYPAGSHGPASSNGLLARHGHRWVEWKGDLKADFLLESGKSGG